MKPTMELPQQLRRLKWNELVYSGDFVEDEHRGIAPWEGPSGFRADSFLKPIYRRIKSGASATRVTVCRSAAAGLERLALTPL